MIVPEFWAEGRIQRKTAERQITVRRYGWSDISLEDAQHQADQRVREAFGRIVSGEKLPRREKKLGYSGADGHPIREEIVDRLGDNVVTRNSYGAQCLNTPNVLFADIDYPGSIAGNCSIILLGIVLGISTSVAVMSLVSNWNIARLLGLISLLVIPVAFPFLIDAICQLSINLRGGADQDIKTRIEKFVNLHPQWHLRQYQSPNGCRLLAMHQTFDPRAEDVQRAFRVLGVDSTYAIMCQKQNCFRARLTGKPWRMGYNPDIYLGRGVWPVAEPQLSKRKRWITEYEAVSADFASCQYLASYGATHSVCEEARAVCDIHDAACKALEDLQLA